MRNIQLLALDMDGTVLHSYSQMNRPVIEAIGRALAQGVKVLFASGRNYVHMQPFFETVGFDKLDIPHITNNGCTIATPDGTVLYHFEPPRDDYETLIGRMAESKIICAVATDIKTYFSDPSFDYELRTAPVFTYNELKKLPRASRISLRSHETEVKMLTEGLAFEYANSIEDYYDIWPMGIDKGTSLQWIADYYGIPIENTMAVGDGDNDLGMLRAAGFSAAMGQGSPRAKEAAAIVGPPVHEDGVAFLIDEYILKK